MVLKARVLVACLAGIATASRSDQLQDLGAKRPTWKITRKQGRRRTSTSPGSTCDPDGSSCGSGFECQCTDGRRLFGAPGDKGPTCTCQRAPSPPPSPPPPSPMPVLPPSPPPPEILTEANVRRSTGCGEYALSNIFRFGEPEAGKLTVLALSAGTYDGNGNQIGCNGIAAWGATAEAWGNSFGISDLNQEWTVQLDASWSSSAGQMKIYLDVDPSTYASHRSNTSSTDARTFFPLLPIHCSDLDMDMRAHLVSHRSLLHRLLTILRVPRRCRPAGMVAAILGHAVAPL